MPRTFVRTRTCDPERTMRATRQLSRFLKPYWHWAVLAPLLMALEVAMDLLQPRLVQRIIDQGIARSNGALVIHTAEWMIAAAAVGLIGGVGCTVFTMLAGLGFGADLRRHLFGHVQTLSFGNLDKLETGALITRLTSDVNQVQDVVIILLRVMVRVPLLLVGSLIMAILTSPRLALLFLPLIPVVLAALLLIIRQTYPLFSQVQQRLDTLNTVLQENLAGVRVVKAFARARYELGRFSQANDALMSRNITAARLSAVTMPFMMLALNGGVVAALWIGGRTVAAGGMHVGQVIAFINYLMQTLMALMGVSMLVIRVSRAEASAQRIQEVLVSEPQVKSPTEPVTLAAPRGRVEFEQVCFSYNGEERDPVLKQVSFIAEPGETVAILGATGAGKSSLVQLIPRFYDVTGGRVSIDGQDVRALDEESLRRSVGVALQEAVLFSGAIRENIRYGRPNATEAEVIAAAEQAQAHEFIVRFPDGYDSVVGQRGVNLSGGQKQRIAIARALLTEPAVLILDDSTSAVDVRTEAAIHAALARRRNQTRFIVAQRISTVRDADKILVLDDGALSACGTHEELLGSNSLYREIYESQMQNGVISDGA
jgi:ATP-binding cassette subfamily B multidrug efflux pump